MTRALPAALPAALSALIASLLPALTAQGEPALTAQGEPALTAQGSYLDGRWSTAGGYRAYRGVSVGGSWGVLGGEGWALRLEGGYLASRGVTALTPSAEALRGAAQGGQVGQVGQGAQGGQGGVALTPLTRPDEVVIDRLWGQGGVLGAEGALQGALFSYPAEVTLAVGGAVWVGGGVGGERARGEALSMGPYSALTASLGAVWLHARLGGAGRPSPLAPAAAARAVLVGAALGRARVGVGVAEVGELGGVASLSLPLSAPLYLGVSAWGSGGGLGEGRWFGVGLRWTGERVAPELDPPPQQGGQGGQGVGPSLPSGGGVLPSSAPPPSVAPRAPGGGLSPGLSPLSPGGAGQPPVL